MRHIFISYAREDEATVNKIREYCEACGINVWMDKESLRLGEPWLQKLREAIRNGAYFILCLSKHLSARRDSIVYREINIALEEMAQKPSDQFWFFPLRLDDCSVPREVAKFNYVDLFPDFDSGAVTLVNRLLERLMPELSPEHIFILGFRSHVMEKIHHFTEMDVVFRKELLDKWLYLLDEHCLKQLTIAFREAHRRLKSTGLYQLDLITEPGPCGRVILLSIAPNTDRVRFLQSLPTAPKYTKDTYVNFIVDFWRNHVQVLPTWHDRDFAHIIYFDDPEDDLLDMLFLESSSTRADAITQSRRKQSGDGPIVFLDTFIYPTSLIGNLEGKTIVDKVYGNYLE